MAYMIWINGAKREVLCWNANFCKNIEESAFPHIGNSNYANLQYREQIRGTIFVIFTLTTVSAPDM